MAEAYEIADAPVADNAITFSGTQRNMAVAFAMFATAVLGFSMDLTHVFFARATAWTFVFWGGLLLYGNLLEYYQTYQVTDAALIIKNPLRPWGATKVWDWAHIHRLDVLVKRNEAEYEDATLQVYFTEEGEITIEREDRGYDPELARLIIERAGLKPTDASNPKEMTQLPKTKATYIWTESGRYTVGG
jgi:hypothetical protein